MLEFSTSTGQVSVGNWGYQLQGEGGSPLDPALLASATHDLLVIDASHDGTDAERFSADEITRIKDGMGGRSVVVSYISIGEASDFRDYWDKEWTTTGNASGSLTDQAPDWLGPLNPDWPESRKVRYWDSDWQEILFNDDRTGDLDHIVDAGFDAAYLDIVDAYYFWGAEVKDKDRVAGDPKNEKQAAQRMVDFVVDMTEHARESNPDFFVIPQNGAWIIDALRNGREDAARIDAYLSVIRGIAIEDLYFRGGRDENNRLRPDEATIRVLQRDFIDQGIPVFVVDYLNDEKKIAQFEQRALADGFIPFAAPDRQLDQLVGTFDGTSAYNQPTAKADLLPGSQLADRIDGRGGADVIDGRGGNDSLSGGRGADQLTGGDGADRFRFDAALSPSNIDTIVDFLPGEDIIALDRSIFSTLADGDLAADSLVIGHVAADPANRIVYDPTDGTLAYDPDGTGSLAAISFARLDPGLFLGVGDFQVV